MTSSAGKLRIVDDERVTRHNPSSEWDPRRTSRNVPPSGFW